MKLIKVRSVLEKDYYINPACIEAVGPDHDGRTKIYMRGDNYYTTTSVEEVVAMIEGDKPHPVLKAGMISPDVHDLVHRATYTNGNTKPQG